MLSVIIPSRNELYLSQTVDDVFAKAKGDIEVIVICDEIFQELSPRQNLHVFKKIGKPGIKCSINQAVDIAQGKYLMKTDAHCMFAEGFDITLINDHIEGWVQVPRRYSLDAKTWTVKDRPPVDYEYMNFASHARYEWTERAKARKQVLLDENMVFQGSCWFTTKQHFLNIGKFMTEFSTGNTNNMEALELSCKTWLSGGKVMVNKKTWYAHLHKGKQYGRGYKLDKRSMREYYEYSKDYWMNDRWSGAIHPMSWLIERFMPPGRME